MSSTTSTDAAPSGGVINRLVRTISGRKSTSTAPASSSPAETPSDTAVAPPVDADASSPSGAAVDTPESDPASSPTDDRSSRSRKLSLTDKLKEFGRRARSRSRSRDRGDSSTAATATTAKPVSAHLRAVTEEVGQAGSEDGSNSSSSSNQTDTTISEPSDLAAKLRALIAELPIPTAPTGKVPKSPKLPKRDKTGKPIPPDPPFIIKDAQVSKLLGSASFMNGSGGKRKPSVWSVLDGLGDPHHRKPQPPARQPKEGEDGETPKQPPPQQDATVMLSWPLVPGAGDVVELAEQSYVTIQRASTAEKEEAGWTDVWPLSVLKGPSPVMVEDVPVQQLIWRPSTTKLSVQAMWWGYRLYLPPPVLAILSNEQLEATKRAAMITTALTWFFNNLPVASMPIAIQPILLLLQRIVPYLGYVGTFISWGWTAIKGFDTGNGVTLTATWLLPFALIPGTWEPYDFPPDPPPAPKPAPAPAPAPAPTPTPAPPANPTPAPAPPANPTPTPADPAPTNPAPAPAPADPAPPTNPTPAPADPANPAPPADPAPAPAPAPPADPAPPSAPPAAPAPTNPPPPVTSPPPPPDTLPTDPTIGNPINTNPATAGAVVESVDAVEAEPTTEGEKKKKKKGLWGFKFGKSSA